MCVVWHYVFDRNARFPLAGINLQCGLLMSNVLLVTVPAHAREKRLDFKYDACVSAIVAGHGRCLLLEFRAFQQLNQSRNGGRE